MAGDILMQIFKKNEVNSVNGKTGTIGITTADIADSADKRYCTDAEKTILTNQATMITLKVCVSVLDDGTISLPATPNGGLLKVWTEAEYMEVHIRADGSIEYIRKTANCDTSDTDAKLCVYDGGSNAIIKNRLGSTKIVSYILEYGTTA